MAQGLRRMWARTRDHALELGVIAGLLLAISATPLAGALPVWGLTALLLAAAWITIALYTLWPGPVSGARLHVRTGLQMASLALPAELLGLGGAMAAVVLLVAVADTLRHAGAASLRTAVGWGLATIAAGELAVAAGAVPLLIAPLTSHASAALGAAGLVVVGQRLGRLTRESERAHRELAQASAHTRALLAHASDLTLVISDAEITYASPSCVRMLGHAPEHLVGMRYLDLVHPDDRTELVRFVERLIGDPYTTGLVTCRLRTADGAYLPVESSCRNLLDDPVVGGVVVNSRDVSERHSLQRELAHQATHDDLTGLTNRRELLARLERLASARGTVAVLYLDLDGFKPVNDTLGHLVGDRVLIAVAERLRAAVRERDQVARIGGDEFAVLVAGPDGEQDAVDVARRLAGRIAQPLTIDEHRVELSASVGIATGEAGDAPVDVLHRADIAMYQAKHDGPGAVTVFAPHMHEEVTRRLRLEQDLRVAVQRDELELHHQPVVALADGRIVGFEALLRWRHPRHGLLAPGAFLDSAERTGEIMPIGRAVLALACRHLAAWRRRAPAAATVRVGVNVSMRQVLEGDLVADVQAALRDAGLDGDALLIELTESALAHDAERARAVLTGLRRLGVRIALDDFGTGYSSLAYLHDFPVDVLKIDRSFVGGADVGEDRGRRLAEAMVDLGHALGLEIVAEGLEQPGQLARFRALGCALGQGHLLGAPATPEGVERLLVGQATGPTGPAALDLSALLTPAPRG